MGVASVIFCNDFALIPQKLTISEELVSEVFTCIDEYAWKSWNFNETVRWIFFRIWNAVKHIFGCSVWQNVQGQFKAFFLEGASEILSAFDRAKIREHFVRSDKDAGANKKEIKGAFEKKIKIIVDYCLGGLANLYTCGIDAEDENALPARNKLIQKLVEVRSFFAYYEFKGQAALYYSEAADLPQELVNTDEDEKAYRACIVPFQAKGHYMTFSDHLNQILV